MLAQLLLSLSFLVAVHEFGHLIAAKYFGMRVEQFSIGFPPKLFSFRKGETEYALSAIPLGGYVKISGMIDESLDTEAMKKPPQPWEFRSKPAWQRLIVMLGGVTVNLIVGVMIFIGITYAFGDSFLLKDRINENGGYYVGPLGEEIGLQTGDKILRLNGEDYEYLQDLIRPQVMLKGQGFYTVERDGRVFDVPIPQDLIQKFGKKENAMSFISYRFEPVIARIQEGSIADRVGLQPGDRIVEVNGVPVTYFDEVDKLVKSHQGDSIAFKVERSGTILSFKEDFRDQSIIGFMPNAKPAFDRMEQRIHYGFLESIPLGAKRAFAALWLQIQAFGMVISGDLPAKDSISGPIGIMQAFGVEWDWARFWSLTGVLSLVLAFVNLLPIPALDGGHVMFLTYEIISRHKPSDKFLETAQKVGMVFLMGLMIFVLANDILKNIGN